MSARRTARVPASRRVPAAHVPHEDPATPGVCVHCPLPLDARNARHVEHPTDLPAAGDDPQTRAAGETRGDD